MALVKWLRSRSVVHSNRGYRPQTGETRILLEDLADIASASRWATTTPIPKETR